LKNLYIELKFKSNEENKENKIIFNRELEKIKDTKPLDLIKFLNDLIEIFGNLNLKTKENQIENFTKKKEKKNNDKEQKQEQDFNKDEEKAIEAYETIIKQLEADKRNNIKVKSNQIKLNFNSYINLNIKY
jgi:hypothetical protein